LSYRQRLAPPATCVHVGIALHCMAIAAMASDRCVSLLDPCRAVYLFLNRAYAVRVFSACHVMSRVLVCRGCAREDPLATHGKEGLHGYFQGPELHRAQGALRGDLPVCGHAAAGRVQEPRRGMI